MGRGKIKRDKYDARREISFASMIMGLNLKNVGTALPHRMQYPIGALSESSHGAGLLSLYPAWIKYEYVVSKEKIEKALNLLGYQKVKDANDAKLIVEDFISKIHTKDTIRDLGVRAVSVQELSEMVSGNIKNDPLGEQKGIIERIYTESLGK